MVRGERRVKTFTPSPARPAGGLPAAPKRRETGREDPGASAMRFRGEAAWGERQEQTQRRTECEKSRLCSGWGITEGLKV